MRDCGCVGGDPTVLLPGLVALSEPLLSPVRCPSTSCPAGLLWGSHQHSLDWSRLSDPGAWLKSAVLVDPVTYTTTDLDTYLENRSAAGVAGQGLRPARRGGVARL